MSGATRIPPDKLDQHGLRPTFAFCSAACEVAARDAPGGKEFFALADRLPDIASACSVDIDLLRILLRAICNPLLQAAIQQRHDDCMGPESLVTGSELLHAHAVLGPTT